MREAIANGDLKEFSYHIPTNARKSEKALENLMNDLAGRGTYERQEHPVYDDGTNSTPPLDPSALNKIAEGVDIYNLLEDIIEHDKDVEEAIQELSYMSGGNIALSPHSGKKKNKKKPTIFREEDEIEEDRAAVQPGGVYPSAKDADDDTNEYPAEPKYKIAKEQSEVEEVANYLLEAGVFVG